MKYCKHCGKEITKRYNVFCDNFCSAKHKAKTFNPNPKKKFIPTENCPECGNLIKQRYNKFCNHSCSARYSNARRESPSIEIKNKIRIGMKKMILANPNYTKEHSQRQRAASEKRIINRIPRPCGECGELKLFKPYRKFCSLSCAHVSYSRRMAGKVTKPQSRFGWYKGVHCQSTWELAFVIWAIDHELKIRRSDLKISYPWRGSIHLYSPDFEIEGKLIEIKGYLHDQVYAKLEACENQGISIELITREQIGFYIDYVKEKYQCDIRREYNKFYSS